MRKIALSTFFAMAITSIFWGVWEWFAYVPRINSVIWSVIKPISGGIQINLTKYSEGLSRSQTDFIGILIFGLIIAAGYYLVFNWPASEMEALGIKIDYKYYSVGELVAGILLSSAILASKGDAESQDEIKLIAAVCSLVAPALMLILAHQGFSYISRGWILATATWFPVGNAIFWGVLYGFLPTAIIALTYLLIISGAVVGLAMTGHGVIWIGRSFKTIPPSKKAA